MGKNTEITFFTEEHGKNLPTVRIKKAVLKDFKSVEYGEIVFNCGKQFVPYDTESDILGIYGQNGSGKTSFIEALAILDDLMSGLSVDGVYADCIAVGKEFAELEFVFDLQYPDGRIREATYGFCMGKKALTSEEIHDRYKDAPPDYDPPETGHKVVIFNEKFYLLWEDASKKQIIIDTSSKDIAFTPDTKRKAIAGNGKNTLVSLEVNKQLAYSKSKSFIFMNKTLSVFNDNDNTNVFFQVLIELRHFARHYLYVVDTKSSGMIRLNFALPIYTSSGRLLLQTDTNRPMIIEETAFEEIKDVIGTISLVLSQLVPGLSIDIKKVSDTLSSKGNPAAACIMVAFRDGKELPLKCESDGVRKIISVLHLITAAFNEKSVTVAIDEFDAGIFEYLLGEILQAMEESGKGQFIFTSHNLRPLEVISKKFLYFTTTNPQNRYIRLRKISATNNLRDTYFREIIVNEQEEEIYNRTKRFKIVSALKKAGGPYHG
jgi:AAA15 family ATPase/GTPase